MKHISVSRLMILAASVFEIPCRKTDKQIREKKTTPTTADGVGSKYVSSFKHTLVFF